MGMHEYWLKQPLDTPLFPDLLWSRPENKQLAGKLLIIGGNEHGFVAPAAAYAAAEQAGVGTARMLLPDSMRRYVGKVFEAGDFAPTTPSGSFAQKALAEFLDMADWADAVLLAGDFGRNSETAILLEKFSASYTGQLTMTGDSADYVIGAPQPWLSRPDTLLVLTFGQLQKLFVASRAPRAVTSTMDKLRLVEAICDFSSAHTMSLIVLHQQTIFTAYAGRISTTSGSELTGSQNDFTVTASKAAVWWLQNPSHGFEALTTSHVSNRQDA